MKRRGNRPQLLRDAVRNQACVATPWDDVVEENIAVRDKHLAVGEVEMVQRSKVGVVISAEKSRGGVVPWKEIRDGGAALRRVRRVGACAGVKRVAVEDKVWNAIEEGTKLRQPINPTGVVAEMDVGENASVRDRHEMGAAQLEEGSELARQDNDLHCRGGVLCHVKFLSATR